MEVLAQLRASFADLKAGAPGRRFCDYYSRKHDRDRGRAVRKWAMVVAGWALIVLGAFLSLVPGIPGIVLAVPGAALVSANSRFFARALDWLEVRLRRLLARRRSFSAKKEAAPRRPR
jgi:hypothetical protein